MQQCYKYVSLSFPGNPECGCHFYVHSWSGCRLSKDSNFSRATTPPHLTLGGEKNLKVDVYPRVRPEYDLLLLNLPKQRKTIVWNLLFPIPQEVLSNLYLEEYLFLALIILCYLKSLGSWRLSAAIGQ